MSGRVVVARLGVGLAAILTLLALVLLLLIHTSAAPPAPVRSAADDLLMDVSFATVGPLVALCRPGNLVGSGLLLAGLGSLVGRVSGLYGELALVARPDLDLPAGAVLAAVSIGAWTALIAGVFLTLATFPRGVAPSRRVAVWIACVLVGSGITWVMITITTPVLDPPLAPRRNPLGVIEVGSAFLLIGPPFVTMLLLSAAVAAVGIIRRFRRSRGLERAQFKWLAGSTALLLVAFPFAIPTDFTGDAAGVPFMIALIILPISIGTAVLRYRLFEIDRIISRTLSYLVLTLILGAAYAVLVIAGQAVFASVAGGSNLAIALSTLVAAALFFPVRTRIQAIVDRRFNRRRYDAQRTLAAFGARLRDQLDSDALDRELRQIVIATMQPSSVSSWRRDGR